MKTASNKASARTAILAGALALASLLLAVPGARAATKVDEGFASQVEFDGRFGRPTDRVSDATAGDDVVYWIQWRDHPVGQSTFRCTVTDESDGEVLHDRTVQYADSTAEGFSFCSWRTHPDDDTATYAFAQYLDGEKVGEQSMTVRKQGFSVRIRGFLMVKLVLLALALVLAGGFWLRRRLRGDADPAEAPAMAPVASPRAGVVIGARVDGGAAPAAAVPLDPAEDALRRARAARAAGDVQAAVAALRGFDKAYPGHALLPEVYLFSAKMMAEDLSNAGMARRILEHLVRKYPGHHAAQDARRYLNSMPQPA